MPPTISQSPRDPAFVQDPYSFYAKAHAMGGTLLWEEYGWPVLCSFAEVNSVFRDRRFGREPPVPLTYPDRLAPFYEFESRSMLERDGKGHARLRALVNRAFVSRTVEAMRGEIITLCHSLIDQLSEGDDLLAGYCEPIPVTVIARLLGVPTERAADLLLWSHQMVAMYQFGRDRAVEDAAVAATLAFQDFVRSEIDRRRREPADDLLSRLIAAEEAGERLSTDELITMVILLLNAGHEATVHALGNGVKTLIEHGVTPTTETAAPVAEEILRYDPPLHMFTRYALEDVDAYGLALKRGDMIGLSLAAAARDPARFEAPEVFDPARADPGHVSLGAGAHFCVGAPLARLEMQVALPILFDRLPGLKLVERPAYADRYHFHGLERLLVSW
ncbi:MAG: cytochrome P450 [Pseudomonadota bacterium]